MYGASEFVKVACALARRYPLGSPVRVQGWVKALRVQKKNVFLDINDGSTLERLQVYLPREKKPDDLSWGSSVQIYGELSQTPKGQLEIVADRLEVVGGCVAVDGYPLVAGQNHSSEYLRQYLHLRPRTDYIASTMRVRDAASRAIHNYFESVGYYNVHAPILTSNDCEGAGEAFRVEPENDDTRKEMMREGVAPEEAYFGAKTFLSVSGQLHLEAAAHGLGQVYTFGPTFRAENSKSRLHLSEFYMVEAEKSYVDNLDDIKNLIENLVKHTTVTVLSKCEKDLKYLRDREKTTRSLDWIDREFKTMTYDEAIDVLQKHTNKFEIPLNKHDGLAKEHELLLVELMDGIPIFVVNWPKELKPFYMRNLRGDNTKVAALDLLTPITGEVAGGSLRENNYEKLKNRLPPGMEWYLELRKFGGSPTGGFGLGFERYLQLICNIPNIKDTIPFPRWPHNCSM